MTIYKAPDWLYRPANIDSLLYSSIKKELLQVFNYKFKQTPFNKIQSQFTIPANIEYVKQTCPTLMKQLKMYGLDTELRMLAFIIVSPGGDYPIHVDTLNPGQMSLGLNIPVLNCNDSYTAWYDTEILYHEFFESSLLDNSVPSTALPCDLTNAVEIARCSANSPHWVNVLKPHAAICNHNKLRVNSSLRFDKKIFEMISDNSFYERCVL